MNFEKTSQIPHRLLWILMAVLVLTLTGCRAEKSPYSFKKNEDRSGYICTGASESVGDKLTIPDTYRGKPVTGIGDDAFEWWTGLQEITLPDSIKRIGSFAFRDCTSLAKINLPNQLEVIEQGAFLNCSSLTEVVIPESVSSIHDFIFSGCDNLETLIVKARLDCLSDRDFGCENLKVIQIPDSVTSFFPTEAQFQYVMTDIYYEGTLEQWLNVDTEFFYTQGLTVHCTDATINWHNGMIFGPGWDYLDYDGGWWLENGICSIEDDYQSSESYVEPSGFVPDYSSVEFANTRSVLGVPSYGIYFYSYSPVKRQDQMLYFIGPDAIKKIPVGGSEADIQIILDGLADKYGKVYEFQVVGDWVYFMSQYRSPNINSYACQIMQLCRVRTDGMFCETIADNIIRPKHLNSEDFNTFVVYGDEIYYTGITETQTSATEYDVESQLCRYNPNTGITEVLERKKVENPNSDSYVISSYNSTTMLIKNLEDGTVYLYYYDDESFTEAPAGIAEFRNYDFYDDGVGGYIGYRVGTLRAFNESNGYSGEIILDSVNPAGVAQVTKSEMVIYGDQIFANFTDANTSSGLQVIENGEHKKINGDFGRNLSFPGDGYLYYTYDVNLYRVCPDGSGWEQLYW